MDSFGNGLTKLLHIYLIEYGPYTMPFEITASAHVLRTAPMDHLRLKQIDTESIGFFL